MLSPRWRKVISDLWSNKTRTLLVIVSIAVGVFALGTIMATRTIVQRDLTAGYRARNPAYTVLYFNNIPVDRRMAYTVRNMPEVADAEVRRSTTIKLQIESGQWVDLFLQVIQDFDNQTVSIIEPEAGAWPPGRREALIDRASMAYIGINIGDPILIEMKDGRQLELKVVGTAHDMDAHDASLVRRTYAYITPETAALIGLPDGYNEVHMVLNDEEMTWEENRDASRAIRDQLRTDGEPITWMWVREPGRHRAQDLIDSLLIILGTLSGMALVLSAFLVINTITAMLAAQKRQIGMMKAVGARAEQIAQIYFTTVTIYGLFALLIAVPLGALGTYLMGDYIAKAVNFDISSYHLLPQVIAVQAGIALLVPVIAGLFPIMAAIRATTQAALNDYGITQPTRRGLLDRAVERVRGLPRPFLLSLRNTFRRKGRLALTLFTLTLAGAIFISVFSVRASLFKTVDDWLAYWGYDVGMNLGGSYRQTMVEREAWRIPGVIAVESWQVSEGQRIRPDGKEGRAFRLYGLPPETIMMEPIMVKGRWLQPGDEASIVLNTEYLRYETDIQVGDTLVMEIEDRDREQEFEVVGIAQGVLTGSIGYVNFPYLNRVNNTIGEVSTVMVSIEEPTPQAREQMAEIVQEHFRTIGLEGAISYTTDSQRAESEYQFKILVAFLLIVVALLTLVGGLGLMGTIGINVLERTREIGLMRAIGASNRAIRQIIVGEAVIIGVISWLIGLVLALPLSQILCNRVGTAFLNEPLRYTFSFHGALLWLLTAILLAMAASFLPAYRTSRLSVREVLAYE
jgi:putative ABC transport system permease protein